MEGELKNLLKICVLTIASLHYCYFIASKVPKGFQRLVSLFPIITFISILPFTLNTLHLGFPTFSCITFITNFKLISFAFDQAGPLSSLPKQENLLCFIVTACFPFKIKSTDHENESPKLVIRPFAEVAIRATLVTMLSYNYDNYRHYFDKYFMYLLFYFFYTYHVPQILFFLAGIPARILLRVELEPQFNSPLFSTSLQDFWGHRWNLRVSDLLRATVYSPIRSSNTCKRIVGDRWASLPAVFVTFVVSGLMHEWLYYYMIRDSPTWEVTWFFVLQGVLVDMEIVLKKKFVATNKFRLHRAISGPLALANIGLTAGWLSYAPIRRHGVIESAIKEFSLFVDFIKGKAVNQI